MISFKTFISEAQEYTSADTSIAQTSAGLKHAIKHGLIKSNSTNVDFGGGKHDIGKKQVEKEVPGSKLHVHDEYNRTKEHNDGVEHECKGKSDYVGMHNVLNVIKEPEERHKALHKMKSFMKPKTGVAHITTYEGNNSGEGKATSKGYQNNRSTHSYVDEVKKVFPEKTHNVTRHGKHIIVTQK